MQVGAAVAVYAKYCVKGCATSAVSSDDNSATDILNAVQQHSSKLLQVASDHQVDYSLAASHYLSKLTGQKSSVKWKHT